ncbi:FAD-binding and BBE domain-containing protein [Hibiscus syriacus]|uniref:FAD-binding and BBE domain-containing protein n=2 Tax=Hibiscus syriacus TaxID=106335 RepID=A0A6A2X6D9_HIBSY|nr:FAD-binding and BBE domain-containing protein [Hibiscus syriacus]
MNANLPELGLQRSDCLETSWVKSTVYWAGFANGTSIDVLLNSVPANTMLYKTKSDYYKAVIPEHGLETLWEVLMDIGNVIVIMNPYGGRMDEISESETAFAHRGGNFFMAQYTVHWSESDGGISAEGRYVDLSRRFFRTMAPYASSNPRAALVNYRDLDIGSNESGETDLEVAKGYGAKYFKNNFMRLAGAKAMIDPENFFKNEQSIPPLK